MQKIIKDLTKYFSHPMYQIYPEQQNQQWEDKNKLQLFLKVNFGLSVFLIVCILSIVTQRSKTPNPLKGKDGLFIDSMNRVIGNTIEQCFIFLPLYAYFTLIVAGEKQKVLAMLIGTTFILSRVIYGFGYVYGISINKSQLRGLGFGIGMLCNAFLIVLNFL